ncbi:DUF724 domain-containing protein 3-like [Euphorbia lathyris]|uniref:DUF724 domain-containing protein 3-like n=1 Tax=Euphorbia lathyris TaxID=212925 RepID=UPI00331344C7
MPRTPRGRGRASMASSKMPFLSKETKVEVSSDDEGFKGAWYRAKIIQNPPERKRKNQIFVEYEDLLDETDPNKPLIESVNTCFIRPLPPPPLPNQTYQPHDVVDAFHRDGWWKGVVTHVQLSKDNKTTYNVVFETPPERFTFSSQHLRFHLDWSHGEWVQPPKQMRMKGLGFFKGMHVEVNDTDAWFSASVVDEVGFNSFLVEYDHNNVREIIDSFHIRSVPPKLVVESFEILEVVEGFHDSCWKIGTISQILKEGRYVVLLKSEDEVLELDQSLIRPHLLWFNGRWVSLCNREIPNITQCEEQSTHVDNTAKHSQEKKKSSVKKLRKNSTPLTTNSTTNKLNKTSPEKEETLASYFHKLRMENAPNRCLSPEESRPIAMLTNTTNIQKECNAFGQQDKGDAENLKQSNVINVEASSELMKKHEMPFKKTLSLWENVDSLQVFKSLPQKAHFSPLLKHNEAIREVYAISNMFNFASLVEKVSKLQIEECRSVFDSYSKALGDLEMYGFDVKAVVDRINKLLLIKIRQEKAKNEWKDLDSQIVGCDCNKAKLKDEVNEIEKMIRELEEKRAMKMKVMDDSERKILEKDAKRLNEEILNLKHKFEAEAAAPWY